MSKQQWQLQSYLTFVHFVKGVRTGARDFIDGFVQMCHNDFKDLMVDVILVLQDVRQCLILVQSHDYFKGFMVDVILIL